MAALVAERTQALAGADRVTQPDRPIGGRAVARYRKQLRTMRARQHEVPAEVTREWRAELVHAGFDGTRWLDACAVVDAACRRTLTQTPFDTQWIAALAMLDDRLVEMATGEGKTLAAGLAAAVTALCGHRVHVITSNDYLVLRDAETLAPLYEALGLRVAGICEGDTTDARRTAYRADIVYATAKSVVFDHLRDSAAGRAAAHRLDESARYLAHGDEADPMVPSLDAVIVDEADSILIDEARVPLILSAEILDPSARLRTWLAAKCAMLLVEDDDYRLDRNARRVTLTAHGRARITELSGSGVAPWINAGHRAEWVEMALSARHLFARGTDYIVRDDTVCIVDPVTGRVAEGRVWSRGLHGLVALKEGLTVPPETETLAQTTYQRFFPRYTRMGGMSGTLREAHRELHRAYGRRTLRLPLRLPSRRSVLPTRVWHDDAALHRALVECVHQLITGGRAVLIGTDSVTHSHAVADVLDAAGIAHRVLNADQSQGEADIIATAGVPGTVTVATNMAGRGTDIHILPALAERGGLHVLSLQLNPSARLDRQLAGRCARQGDPGSTEHWLTATLMIRTQLPLSPMMTFMAARGWSRVTGRMAKVALAWYQWQQGRIAARERARLQASDKYWDECFGAN